MKTIPFTLFILWILVLQSAINLSMSKHIDNTQSGRNWQSDKLKEANIKSLIDKLVENNKELMAMIHLTRRRGSNDLYYDDDDSDDDDDDDDDDNNNNNNKPSINYQQNYYYSYPYYQMYYPYYYGYSYPYAYNYNYYYPYYTPG